MVKSKGGKVCVTQNEVGGSNEVWETAESDKMKKSEISDEIKPRQEKNVMWRTLETAHAVG